MLPFGAFQEDATQPPFPRAHHRWSQVLSNGHVRSSRPQNSRALSGPTTSDCQAALGRRWHADCPGGGSGNRSPRERAFLRAGAGRASAEPLPSASGRQEAAWGGEDGHRGSPATLEPRRTCSPHQRGRGVSRKRGGAESASLEFRPWSVARSWTPSLRMSHDTTCPQANPKHGEGLAPSGGAGLG